MAAVLRPQPVDAEQLRLQALEQMLRALCEQISQLADRACAIRKTREADFQRMAFEERRNRGLAYLQTERYEAPALRIGNLQRHIEALECSRVYFSAAAGTDDTCNSTPRWAVLVR